MVAICPKKGYNFRVSSVHFLLPSWWTGGGSLITGNVTHAITDSLFTVFESKYFNAKIIIDIITITTVTMTVRIALKPRFLSKGLASQSVRICVFVAYRVSGHSTQDN